MNESIISNDEIINREYYEGIKDIIICSICLNIVSDPLQCDKCQHCFCSECIRKCLQCPFRCINSNYTPAFLCKKLLSEIQIKCACGEILKYDAILKHKAEDCKINDVKKKNVFKKRYELEKQKLYKKKDFIIPNFKLLNKGSGIDDHTFDVLIHASYEALKAREDPLSEGIIKRIKLKIEGGWMVFAFINGLRGYDYAISNIRYSDGIDFLIDRFRFQIYKTRKN